MKFKNLYIIIKFILFIIIPKNTIITANNENYVQILISILKVANSECYEDAKKIYNLNNEYNSSFPWIFDYIGKGFNDLGDETECINSLVNTSFLMIKSKIDFPNINEKFLDINTYSYGLCIPTNCKDIIIKNIKLFRKFINLLFGENKIITNNSNFEIIESSKNIEEQKIKSSYRITYLKTEGFKYTSYIMSIFFIYIILKIIAGIFRMVFIPKGYNKYALDLLNQKEDLGIIDEEEKINLSKRKESIITFLEGNLYEYNPNYDFSSFLPIKLRILGFFDIFNDIMLLTKKRNRYYNDDGLEIIAFMRFFLLFSLIFTETFNSLISLPSGDIFNENIFKSIYFILYRISINSFTCLIVLEGANITYKLNKYIKSSIYDKNNNNNKIRFELKLLIICIKFLLYFIPKLFIFLISYYFFYYKAEDFVSIISSKVTYKYIINNIFKKNIKCEKNPFPIFNNYTSFLSINITDYFHCYEFTYYSFNIMLCTLFYMLILYLSFLIRNKIFDIFVLFVNLFFFFFSVWIIKDTNTENQVNYSYYHFIGQKYSTKIIYSFIGFYYIGYILWFLLFYIDNEINNNYTGYLNISLNNKNKEILNEDEINNLDIPKISKNEIKEDKLSYYYPLSFFKYFIFWIYKINDRIKILIIFISFLFIILLSSVYNIIIIYKDYTNIELSIWIKLYFYYEKHLFIIFFLIIILLLNSFINKDSFIVNTKFIYLISRSGFTIICQYYFLSYFSLSTYFIKVKYHILAILLLSIGNFIFFSIFSFLCNVAFELPIKIVIKTLLTFN